MNKKNELWQEVSVFPVPLIGIQVLDKVFSNSNGRK